MNVTKTDELKPLGTSHWCGTFNNCPAILLGYYGGASIFYFQNNKWNKEQFNSLSEAYTKLGLTS